MNIAIFALSNFFKVQGSTEPYYVYRYLTQRYRVLVFVPQDNFPSQNRVFLVKHFPKLPTFVSYNLQVLPALLGQLARSVDLIYTYKSVVTPVLLLKFLFRKKWICDFRTSPVAQELEFRRLKRTLSVFRRLSYLLARLFYRVTLRYCDLVVAISDEVKQELIEDYCVPAHKIYVQTLGVDLELFKSRRAMPRIEGELRLIYNGTIAPQRGLDTVIQALSKLQGRVPVRLLLVGQGSQEAVEALKTLARNLGVEDRIEWRGYMPHEQIPGILETCHVALSPLPALQAYQVSSPSKVFEYLAMGKVVVATDILAHRKLIQHRTNGLLVPPGDSTALAKMLEGVYHDKRLRAHLIENARASVQSYSWKVLLPELQRRIQALLA